MDSAPVVGKQKKQDAKTRARRIEDNGGTPLLPEVDAAYMVGHWYAVGQVMPTGQGVLPLSAAELRAWQQGRQADLAPWEFQTLLDMSRAYVGQLHESEKPECPPPFGDAANEFDREIVSKKVANAFKAFQHAKKK